MKKRILYPVIGILSFVVAIPTYSATISIINRLCRRPSAGIVEELCKLRDKVADHETRIVELENQDPIMGPPGPMGTQGERGLQGEQGPQGIQGPPGTCEFPTSNTVTFFENSVLEFREVSPSVNTTGYEEIAFHSTGPGETMFVVQTSVDNSAWVDVIEFKIKGGIFTLSIQGTYYRLFVTANYPQPVTVKGFLSADAECKEGPPGPSGPKGEQGIQGEKGEKGDTGEMGQAGNDGTSMHLIDANGQDLGVLVSTNNESSQFVTYLPTLDAIFSIRQFISSDPLPPSVKIETLNTWGGVYFLQENCDGDPYVAVNYNPARPHTIFFTANRFFKIKDEFVGPTLTKSSLIGGGLCANSGFPEPLVLIKAEEVALPFFWPPTGPLKVVEQ